MNFLPVVAFIRSVAAGLGHRHLRTDRLSGYLFLAITIAGGRR